MLKEKSSSTGPNCWRRVQHPIHRWTFSIAAASTWPPNIPSGRLHAAGFNPESIKKATVVTWLLLNVYKTGDRLHRMKKVATLECVLCLAPLDDCLHFGLKCSELFQIRNQYINKFIDCCPNLKKYLSDENLLSRNYFYDIHRKHEMAIEAKVNTLGRANILHFHVIMSVGPF